MRGHQQPLYSVSPIFNKAGRREAEWGLNHKIINIKLLIAIIMEAGRQRNNDTKMKGCLNLENKLTDTYLPRKCDFTDRVVTSKDHSSIQLSICDVPSPISRSMLTAPSTWANLASSLFLDS
jgi:hypothetical protein